MPLIPTWIVGNEFVSFHKTKKRFTLTIVLQTYLCLYLPWWLRGEESACNVGDLGLIPGLGRPCEVGNGYPLQYSCLENSMDRGVWRAIVCGIAKSQTRLRTHACLRNISHHLCHLIDKKWQSFCFQMKLCSCWHVDLPHPLFSSEHLLTTCYNNIAGIMIDLG